MKEILARRARDAHQAAAFRAVVAKAKGLHAAILESSMIATEYYQCSAMGSDVSRIMELVEELAEAGEEWSP